MGIPQGNVVPIGDHARARSRLSPQESATLLSGCRELALDKMSRALGGMLDRVEDELFSLAEKATDREAQNVLLDARAQARSKRAAIEGTFRRHFADFFNRKVRGDASTSSSAPSGELSLLGTEELEESLAVNEMSRKAGAACEGELGALSQRMGFLLQRPELADEANPVSPATICAALKDACDQLESGFKVRMALLRQLEGHVMAELQTVYRDLNAHLVERRVLPDVRPFVRRAQSASPAKGTAEAKAEESKDLFSTLAGLLGSGAGAQAPGGPANPFAALAASQGLAGMPGGAGAGGMIGGVPAATAPLVESLTQMHRHVTPEEARADGHVNRVRELKSAPQAASLPPIEAMTIDIVAMLFDYVFEDRHIPDSIKAQLGRLQIPTLKVALIDKTFFSAKSHPARRLIDLLADASIGMDVTHPRGAATLKLVEEVVERVLAEFGTDIGLFESLVERVEAFVAEGQVTEADIVQRSAATIEARERAETAFLAAIEEVERRLSGRAWVPPTVRAMLETTWARALAVAYEASGTGGAWAVHVQAMDDLLWSVEPKAQPEERKRLVGMLPTLLRSLQDGFERGGLSARDRDIFLGELVDCHAAAVKAGLRGIASLPDVPLPRPVEEPVSIERQIVPADGGLQVEEIRLKASRGVVRNVFTRTGIWTNVQRGTWVEFGGQGEDLTRARLTWISPNKGVYLFTNPASARRAISISPEALAEQMRLGEARILDDAPLVERAVDSMIANLRAAPEPA